MSYSKLIQTIFGEPRICISEIDFIALLPSILITNKPKWTKDKLTRLLILRYRLAGEKEHTFKQLSKIYGVCISTISNKHSSILRRLRHPSNSKRYSLND